MTILYKQVIIFRSIYINVNLIAHILEGQGLAYVVYPYAATTIVGGPFWAILFFIMMILLGIDSTVFEIFYFK